MEDVQGSADVRGIAIDEVGVKDLRHPIKVAGSAGIAQHTVATLSMSVSLPHNHKGTHMSRFLERLNSQDERYIGRIIRQIARGDAALPRSTVGSDRNGLSVFHR